MAKQSRSKKNKNGDADNPEPRGPDGRLSVLIELRSQAGNSGAVARSMAETADLGSVQIDPEFEPVPLGGEDGSQSRSGDETYLVRGTVKDESEMDDLRAHPDVARVWPDVPIAPFAEADPRPAVDLVENPAAAACPIPPCDCSPLTPKGSLADVATYLRANQIWAAGYRGAGIVVGVVDGGITAQGRPVIAGETTRRIDRVVGGWPTATWGTRASAWSEHGNMCATGVLGIAPEARIYDLRISGGGGSVGTISRAIQAYQWAINKHKSDGTPHVLSNSWGIYKESWAPGYARDPNHPFTRKVVEAMNEGILVLFAAGNCGDTCPSGRCGSDTGPGKSIWGANGHRRVMTVGAVNRNEQFVGYSSQGPAALHADKPDFCSITHYRGYNNSDNGTSAACPVAAGVVALLKQANAGLTQDLARGLLKATAKDIGPGGFDRHSGAGIIRPKGAFDRIRSGTNPIADRLRTRPSRDILRTVARFDRLRTLPRIDMIRTPPRVDIIRTRPDIDMVTRPDLDRRDTPPQIDFVKSPRLDTLQERAKPPGDRLRDPVRERILVGGRRPFVLSTPHRAPHWESAEGGAGHGEIEAEIEEVGAYYEALLAAYYGDDMDDSGSEFEGDFEYDDFDDGDFEYDA